MFASGEGIEYTEHHSCRCGRGEKFVIDDDEGVANWLDLLGGEVGSTRSRQAKERESAQSGAAPGGGDGGDTSASGGDVMQTD